MSKDYETVKITDSKASLKVKIGTVCRVCKYFQMTFDCMFFSICLFALKLDMGVEKLTENLSSLILKVREQKKYLTGKIKSFLFYV